jgi:radical SAM-linked protein
MRVRFRFTKFGKVRFTSHRDVARMWERALRRAELPVARTEGFSPRPKVHFGLALSTGHESLGEYLDVDLVADAAVPELDELPARLTPLLPEGLEVEAAAEVDPRAPSLQQAVTSCGWWLDLPDVAPSDLAAEVARVLAAERLPVTRERKGQPVTDDLRPGILDLSVGTSHPADGPSTAAGHTRLVAELATQPRGIRLGELMAVFAPPRPDPITVGGRVIRTHQWITTDGAACEPLGPAHRDATSVPHARRAS